MSDFKNLFGSASKSSNTIWMSTTDLMSGLMIVFMFIAIAYRSGQLYKSLPSGQASSRIC